MAPSQSLKTIGVTLNAPDGFEPSTDCLEGSSAFSGTKGFGGFSGCGLGQAFFFVLLVAAQSGL